MSDEITCEHCGSRFRPGPKASALSENEAKAVALLAHYAKDHRRGDA